MATRRSPSDDPFAGRWSVRCHWRQELADWERRFNTHGVDRQASRSSAGSANSEALRADERCRRCLLCGRQHMVQRRTSATRRMPVGRRSRRTVCERKARDKTIHAEHDRKQDWADEMGAAAGRSWRRVRPSSRQRKAWQGMCGTIAAGGQKRKALIAHSPPVLQLIVKRRAGGHGTSLKKVTCARIRSHLSLLH